ncbi:MAG: hypothetical protein J2P50_00245 [Hyphomicrobiaceae bacterium]|nr:hypothetical protein [Hyphomicrobiaceae bacterium]
MSTDEQIAASAREALGPKVVADFCAMPEQQKLAYLTKRLRFSEGSAVNVGGRWYDSTVVTSRELAAERVTWRRNLGC